jgi:hypothetical protein
MLFAPLLTNLLHVVLRNPCDMDAGNASSTSEDWEVKWSLSLKMRFICRAGDKRCTAALSPIVLTAREYVKTPPPLQLGDYHTRACPERSMSSGFFGDRWFVALDIRPGSTI